MGCFSYKCLECGRGVQSSSFSGEQVHICLLKKGEIIQQMTGEYNSYGAVFVPKTQRKDVKHKLRESQEWKNPETGVVDDEAWSKVCNLILHDEYNQDYTSGFAFIHVDCYKTPPTHASARDPNQGWGEDDELLGDCAPEGSEYRRLPPVPGYNAIKEIQYDLIRSRLWRLDQDIAFQGIMSEGESRFKDIHEKRVQQMKIEESNLKLELEQLKLECPWIKDER